MNIYQKLIEVRKSVPYLQKDTKGYQYSYVSGSTVLGSLKKKMDELGLLLSPSVIDYEYKLIPTREKGVSYEKPSLICKMNMTWIDSASGESYSVPFISCGTQDDISKAFGSALTYSERYFLLKFFNIPTDMDDPDSFQERNSYISDNQILEIESLIAKKKIDRDKFLKFCKVSSLDKIQSCDYKKFISALEAK